MSEKYLLRVRVFFRYSVCGVSGGVVFFRCVFFLLQGNVTSILGRAVPGQVWHVHVDLFLCKKSASQPVRVFVCYMK